MLRGSLSNWTTLTFAYTVGGNDSEQSRPSSSGGRLEQHLGAVESIEIPSNAAISPSVPTASRAVGFPSGPRVANITATTARNEGRISEGPGRNLGGRSGGATTENPRAFRGGSGTGLGSSANRAIDEQSLARRISGATQMMGGRRARDRKGGGRRRSAADSAGGPMAGVDSSSLAKGGAGRGKVDGNRVRPRRASSQVSFGSSLPEGGSGGGGGDGVRAGGDIMGEGKHDTEGHTFRTQAGHSNTLVAVRLRPLLKHDREQIEVAKVR